MEDREMKMLAIFLLAGLIVAGQVAAAQETGTQAPIASNPIVELKGKISKVQTAPGQGMPSLEVEGKEGTFKVLLGSMRYLMQQNFNPKAGEEVVVKGYKQRDQVVATAVTLPGENKTLQLRDDQGRPVWMSGRHGRRGRQGGMRGRGGAAQREPNAP
jgi:hypothetical protein